MVHPLYQSLKVRRTLTDGMSVGQALSTHHARNGGFPEPLDGERVRVVAARHAGCAQETRVRIPHAVPARAVRRVRCSSCSEEFETETIEELEEGSRTARLVAYGSRLRAALPSVKMGILPTLPLQRIEPSGSTWRLLSVPAAAALVIGGLLVIQGSSSESGNSAGASPVLEAPAGNVTPPPSGVSTAAVETGRGPAKHTELVQGSSYHLILPEGWEKIDPPGGATFAAVSADGDADVTLWIREDKKLDFLDFAERSRDQLTSLTGSQPKTVEEVIAPTPEETILRLAANAPPGSPQYEVLLRAAGPYRYSFSSTLQPGASRETIAGLDLISNSLTPEAEAE